MCVTFHQLQAKTKREFTPKIPDGYVRMNVFPDVDIAFRPTCYYACCKSRIVQVCVASVDMYYVLI